MTKYTINHICGHSREIQLDDKIKEPAIIVMWLAKQECPACWGEKRRKEEIKKFEG